MSTKNTQKAASAIDCVMFAIAYKVLAAACDEVLYSTAIDNELAHIEVSIQVLALSHVFLVKKPNSLK